LAVPDYQSFMRPLLAFGADGQEKNINAAIDALADQFRLTPEDRQLLLPSGKQTLLTNRVHWARTYLDKAGALRRTRRSHFVVTDRGRQLLTANPVRIDARILRQFPEFLAFQTPRIDRGETEGAGSDQPLEQRAGIEPPSATPEETLQSATDTISEALRTQLLDRMRELSPAFFERLVVDLIVAMGYGGTRSSVVQALGKTGDEGIDGVVNEDPLGLDVVYIQAKRYAPDNTIGRDRIQQFAGALVGQGAAFWGRGWRVSPECNIAQG
jgi:restriction system protein